MCVLQKYNLEKAARISGNNNFFIEKTVLECISKPLGQNVGFVMLKLEEHDVGRELILFTF
jgi:hypothetical protein